MAVRLARGSRHAACAADAGPAAVGAAAVDFSTGADISSYVMFTSEAMVEYIQFRIKYINMVRMNRVGKETINVSISIKA